MNNFANNLKFIIAVFDETQASIALHIERKQTTISNWVNGLTEPDITDLLKLHQFFGISLDVMVFYDIANSNLSTPAALQNFKLNSNLIGNVNGNLSAKKGQNLQVAEDAKDYKKLPKDQQVIRLKQIVEEIAQNAAIAREILENPGKK